MGWDYFVGSCTLPGTLCHSLFFLKMPFCLFRDQTQGLLENLPACSVREHRWIIVVKVIFFLWCVSFRTTSPRGWWVQWVKWFTRKVSEGGFRWSMASAKLEVTKRLAWRAAFQKANTRWIGLVLFHPRGHCSPPPPNTLPSTFQVVLIIYKLTYISFSLLSGPGLVRSCEDLMRQRKHKM